jgi:hypothetical protein
MGTIREFDNWEQDNIVWPLKSVQVTIEFERLIYYGKFIIRVDWLGRSVTCLSLIVYSVNESELVEEFLVTDMDVIRVGILICTYIPEIIYSIP